MSRVINLESAGKDRTRLVKTVVLALRELMRQQEPDASSRDLVAYISVALMTISETIDVSVAAWEKRGYWVKADRFRMEWDWAAGAAKKLQTALQQEDWGTIAMTAALIGQKFSTIKIAEHNRLGTPWVGASKLLK
ncbi:MAG TPA: hypothetical protein VN376_05635 [Longilinea sp.]|nr:hypothetical protein [Longilinea sp.]